MLTACGDAGGALRRRVKLVRAYQRFAGGFVAFEHKERLALVEPEGGAEGSGRHRRPKRTLKTLKRRIEPPKLHQQRALAVPDAGAGGIDLERAVVAGQR